jgi:pimeloyl-ACP methyl ester carboxylesterase
MRIIHILRRALLTLGLVTLVGAGTNALAADAAPAPTGGKMERIIVHGKSLEGNLAEDTADRIVYVYLPPSYGKGRKHRYPVVYFLHGILAHAENYVATLGLPGSIDRAITAGNLQEMIFVLPDAMNPYEGSMYSNSITTGNWEDFIARDLVSYIDGHYRTLAKREARGLAGHSMGGYGTLRIGMKNPDVYSSLYAMSSCCLDPRGVAPSDAGLEKLASREDVEKLPPFGRLTLAAASAWTPNAQRPPLFFDLPTKDGKPVPEVLAQFAANAPSVMVAQYAPNLKRYKAITVDAGRQDPISFNGTTLTSNAMTRVGVLHVFEPYDGDHMNKIPGRFEKNVVLFFATNLAAR